MDFKVIIWFNFLKHNNGSYLGSGFFKEKNVLKITILCELLVFIFINTMNSTKAEQFIIGSLYLKFFKRQLA
jgi:hypothetical protein